MAAPDPPCRDPIRRSKLNNAVAINGRYIAVQRQSINNGNKTTIKTPIDIYIDVWNIIDMLTSAQLRASRALLGIDQRTLADWAGVSLPTIQRMEASDGYVRGVVDTLTKVVAALELAGVELIGENSISSGGGRGVRLREPATPLGREPKARASELAAKRKGSQLPA